METVLLPAGMHSRLIVIKSGDKGYTHFNKDNFVLLGEESIFSPFAKIETERAQINDKYVHLRFSQSNRYWVQSANGRSIIAESRKPEEDTTKPSCTLFEAVGAGNVEFYLNHVQSGGRLLFDDTTMIYYVELHPQPQQGHLSFANWSVLVKMPKHVAFRGINGSWLAGVTLERDPYLQFSSNDPNANECEHEVHLMNDGDVRIKSKHFDRFWRRSNSNWIWAESSDSDSDSDKGALFRPIKNDKTTVVFRNVGNSLFCRSFTSQGKENCLNAQNPMIIHEARLVVQELVLSRKVYNVRFWVENARIYDERPFQWWRTVSVANHETTPADMAVEIRYEGNNTQIFSHNFSFTEGVNTTLEAGVPFINTKGGIEVSDATTGTMEWGMSKIDRITHTANGTVSVPAKSVATVSYVGTTASCNVPFSYTQQDISSTDGKITESDHTDGVFIGRNSYNFSFVIDQIQPL